MANAARTAPATAQEAFVGAAADLGIRADGDAAALVDDLGSDNRAS